MHQQKVSITRESNKVKYERKEKKMKLRSSSEIRRKEVNASAAHTQ